MDAGHRGPPVENPPPAGPDDWFVDARGPDAFSAESIFTVGALEDVAGSHGPLKRVGDDFQFADGTPSSGASTPNLPRRYGECSSRRSSSPSTASTCAVAPRRGLPGLRNSHGVRRRRLLIGLPLVCGAGRRRRFTRRGRGFTHAITPSDGYRTGLYNEVPNKTVKGVAGKSTSGVGSCGFKQAEWTICRPLWRT